MQATSRRYYTYFTLVGRAKAKVCRKLQLVVPMIFTGFGVMFYSFMKEGSWRR